MSSSDESSESEDAPSSPATQRITNEEDVIVPEKKIKLGSTGRKNDKSGDKVAKMVQKATDKIYKPGECMKHMTVEMHPDFLMSSHAAYIGAEMSVTGAQIKASPDLFDINVVMWSRRSNQALQLVDGKVQLGTEQQRCGRCVVVMTGDELSVMINNQQLSQHLNNIVALTGCSTTLVAVGAKDYIKNKKATSILTKVQLEMALTDILVTTGCDSIMVNTPHELARLIVQFTKSIAEKPFKEAKYAIDDQVEFYMRGDNKKCVAVDADGHGMSRVWQQMLAVLPQSSLEVSRAVAADYPSPQMLYEMLESPDGVTTIADVGVTRAAVPGVKARRVGPEFARKLKLLFTASDGNILVD